MSRTKKTKRKASPDATSRAGGKEAVDFMPPVAQTRSLVRSRLPVVDEISALLSRLPILDTQLVPELKECFDYLQNEMRLRETLIREINKRAPGSLTELVDAGADIRKIIAELATIRSACRPTNYPPPSIPGISLQDLRKLPALLLTIADQLEAINEHRIMPSLIRSSSRRTLRVALRLFSRDFKKRLAKARRRTRGMVEPGTREKLALIWYIRETTKDNGPHYKAVAAVLNAFNELEDEKSGGTSKKVTGNSLKQLNLANPKLHPTSVRPVR